MHSKPIISIICATYNRAALLPRAIDSVLAQDFQAWELLIIDDGSSDNTADIVTKYADDYRIKYLPLATNGGVGKARNYGIAHALGEWTMVLDSDNAFAPNALNEIINATIEHPGYSLHRFNVVSFSGRPMSAALDSPRVISAVDYLNKRIPGENHTLIKAKTMQANKFPESVSGGEHITWSLVAFQVGEMLYHPIVTLHYDEQGADRLSVRSKNFGRLRDVFLLDVRTLWSKYLRFAKLRIFEVSLKLVIYSIINLVSKSEEK